MVASYRPGERNAPHLRAPLARRYPERIGFVWGALTNMVTTSIAFLVAPQAQLAHLMIIHLLGAVLISTRYGMAVSTFTAVTGALAFDYFCIPPVFAFAMPDPHAVVSFAGMLAVALLVCWLNQGVRRQRAAARESEERTQAVCQLSLDLSQVTREQELSVRAQHHLRELFGASTDLRLTRREPPNEPGFGWHAIRDQDTPYGYIRVTDAVLRSGRPERRLLLAACADRVADALKRLELGELARRAEIDAEVERNRNTLLSAVSHDLKTPLASILTAGTSLLDRSVSDDAGSRELLETIVQESERMNGLITNLLSVTRLESGGNVLVRELEALDDLVFAVLSRFSGRLVGRHVSVDIPNDLPLVSIDPGMIDQVLANLLENALRYSPSGSAITVRCEVEADGLAVAISDSGPGIAPAERERVFERFYRGVAAKQNDGGTGLGLTICRAVVSAHGGRIGIFAEPGGGTCVRFSLPLGPVARGAVAGLERRYGA
jgi:two-component system, OmpR family, sensor histidine kinase KdpD